MPPPWTPRNGLRVNRQPWTPYHSGRANRWMSWTPRHGGRENRMTSWITRATGKLFTTPAMEGRRSCSTGTEPPSTNGEDPDPLGAGDHNRCPMSRRKSWTTRSLKRGWTTPNRDRAAGNFPPGETWTNPGPPPLSRSAGRMRRPFGACR